MNKNIKAFLGDYYHPREPLENAVREAIKTLTNVTMEVNNFTENTIKNAIDSNPSLIIIGGENRLNPTDAKIHLWLTSAIDANLENYVANGGNLLVLHSGIASYPTNSLYRKMVKGHFVSHPPEHVEVKYSSVRSDYPLVVEDFSVLDEFYVIEVDEDETNVFLKSFSEEFGVGYGGWGHNYKKGKVLVVVPTHNENGLKNSENIKLYRDAIISLIGE